MASAVRSSFLLQRLLGVRQTVCGVRFKYSTEPTDSSLVTHTGQNFETTDYRNVRFENKEKLVNPNWAIDFVAEEPIVVCEKRAVFSDGGGALGHPRVFINLDPPQVQTCGYSGRRFIQKKYYKESEHGPSITHEQYIKEMNPQEKDWPN